MKVALYQMEIVAGKPDENYSKVENWAKTTMVKESPDVLVLPEMWTTSYVLEEIHLLADIDGQKTKAFLKKLSFELNVNIVAGSIANNKSGEIYNTAYIYNRQGELVYEYDKVHLVPMLNEPDFLQGGQVVPQIFEIDGIKASVVICYDLRFTEIIRPLALQGAQILFVVAEWPINRVTHWDILNQARSIENQMFVVSCNCVGTNNGTTFAGSSAVINPWGEIVKKGATDKEESLIASLDIDSVNKFRQEVPIFSSRIPQLYK